MPIRREYQNLYEEKAVAADAEAEKATSARLVDSWRHVARTYRWLAYHQLAIGKWQSPAKSDR